MVCTAMQARSHQTSPDAKPSTLSTIAASVPGSQCEPKTPGKPLAAPVESKKLSVSRRAAGSVPSAALLERVNAPSAALRSTWTARKRRLQYGEQARLWRDRCSRVAGIPTLDILGGRRDARRHGRRGHWDRWLRSNDQQVDRGDDLTSRRRRLLRKHVPCFHEPRQADQEEARPCRGDPRPTREEVDETLNTHPRHRDECERKRGPRPEAPGNVVGTPSGHRVGDPEEQQRTREDGCSAQAKPPGSL